MNRVRLKDFRCFREEQEAVLAPLTLLVGENSTGKTSFMAAVRVLWDVLYGRREPDFKEDPYDLGSFDDIAHYRGGRSGRAESFSMGFDLVHEGEEGRATQRCQLDAVFGRRSAAPFLLERRFADPDTNTWIELVTKRAKVVESRYLRVGTAESAWEIVFAAKLGFGYGYVPPLMVPDMADWEAIGSKVADFITVRKTRGHDDSDAGDKQQIQRLQGLLEKVRFGDDQERPYASAPVRSKPRRTYDPSRFTRDPEGAYVPMYLSHLNARRAKSEWDDLKRSLEEFGRDSGLFDEIGIRRLGKLESDPFQLQIRKFGRPAKGPHRNVIDVGYGVSQVLPVVTELLRNQARRIFLLQQPEVHLHPSAQAALGSLFCRVAGPERQLIVETHSDHVLDRIRMDVRDGVSQLRPSDVSILFFERRNLGVRIHSLRIDDQGNVLGAPTSYRRFFMDEVHRSIGL